jgi:hypothetical protein
MSQTCPECSRHLTQRYDSCPSCGYPLSQKPATGRRWLVNIAAGLGTVGIAAAATMLFLSGDTSATCTDDHVTCFNRAAEAVRRGDHQTALGLFRDTCDDGFDEACYRWAVVLRSADGIDNDPRRARKMFRRLCEDGQALSCGTLGNMTLRGDGGPADDRRARSLYELACHGGDTLGCATLGGLYVDGRGGPAHQQKGRDLLQTACEQHDIDHACEALRTIGEDRSAASPSRKSDTWELVDASGTVVTRDVTPSRDAQGEPEVHADACFMLVSNLARYQLRTGKMKPCYDELGGTAWWVIRHTDSTCSSAPFYLGPFPFVRLHGQILRAETPTEKPGDQVYLELPTGECKASDASGPVMLYSLSPADEARAMLDGSPPYQLRRSKR